jgi:hypothetical protein
MKENVSINYTQMLLEESLERKQLKKLFLIEVTPWRKVFFPLPPTKLTAAELINNLCAFYGKRRFIYAVHMNSPLQSVLSQLNPVHLFTPNVSKSYFNIIIPSMYP